MLSSVSRCLEPLMKHAHSFLIYYIQLQPRLALRLRRIYAVSVVAISCSMRLRLPFTRRRNAVVSGAFSKRYELCAVSSGGSSLPFFLIRFLALTEMNIVQWKKSMILHFSLQLLVTSKHYRSRCWSRWENLHRGQHPFQPIKFVNLVVPSPCKTEPYNNLRYWTIE